MLIAEPERSPAGITGARLEIGPRRTIISQPRINSVEASWWKGIRRLAGAALLAVVLWRLGTGPVVHGISTIDVPALLAAVGITGLTTVCCAWRWSLVARGFGVALPLRVAVPAYYRSQFLNSTLPGGMLGDVHRAMNHGGDVGDVGLGVRTGVWERSAGQVVQLLLTAIALVVLPSPVRGWMPMALAMMLVISLIAYFLGRRVFKGSYGRAAAALRMLGDDVRSGVLAPGRWPGILASSVLVVLGHVAVFLIAARTSGSAVSTSTMLPIALLALCAMGLPLNIGGWGPREGMAAWAFGAAGLGAPLGFAVSVTYGVMALVATLPGAAVLAVNWLGGKRRPQPGARLRRAATASTTGPSHG